MKKLYDKSELGFSLCCIGAYVLCLSLADNVSKALGTEKLLSFPTALAISLLLIFWLRRHGLFEKYGLCRPKADSRRLLYYLPLLIVVSCNTWFGFTLNLSVFESILYVLTMLCVGFIEELIFRGFLFKALCRDGIKTAVIISSLTFGMGHIVNLFNGSGMEFLPNLCQLCYAAAAGFMFVMLFIRSGSLLPCIAAHSALNALSAFAVEPGKTAQIISAAMLCLVSLAYTFFLAKQKISDKK